MQCLSLILPSAGYKRSKYAPKKECTVLRSSVEVEYRALATLSCEIQ